MSGTSVENEMPAWAPAWHARKCSTGVYGPQVDSQCILIDYNITPLRCSQTAFQWVMKYNTLIFSVILFFTQFDSFKIIITDIGCFYSYLHEALFRLNTKFNIRKTIYLLFIICINTFWNSAPIIFVTFVQKKIPRIKHPDHKSNSTIWIYIKSMECICYSGSAKPDISRIN